MKILFTEEAWEDYLYWQLTELKPIWSDFSGGI
jgi:Txe/YoeB family toxin of Txe-Axe toxin-antitoxin module